MNDLWTEVCDYLPDVGHDTVEAARCGEGALSTAPTLLWAGGTAVLAQWLVRLLFRRFLFRRIPMWELIVQELVFTWLLVYGMRLWFLLIRLIKTASYAYAGEQTEYEEIGEEIISENLYMVQQSVIWLLGMVPLGTAIYIYTRTPPQQPIMIWIAASPWQRREMGPYGYYLSRPPTAPQTRISSATRTMVHRRCFSDTDIMKTNPGSPRKRCSKSV